MKTCHLLNEKLYINEVLDYLKEKTDKEYEVIKDNEGNIVIADKNLNIKKLVVTPLDDECDWNFECFDNENNDQYNLTAVFLWSFEVYQDEKQQDYINAIGGINGVLCFNTILNLGDYLTYEEVYEIISKRG